MKFLVAPKVAQSQPTVAADPLAANPTPAEESVVSFELANGGREIQICCDEEGMAIFIRAVDKVRADRTFPEVAGAHAAYSL